MPVRGLTAVLALAVLIGAGASAQAFDQSRYPDWKGQWLRTGRGNGNAWGLLGLGREKSCLRSA
jgi:hypothetical protein